MNCPLCHCSDIKDYHRRIHKPHWEYFLCGQCWLIFRDPLSWPKRPEEEQRYKKHNNSGDQPGYIGFLQRIIPPVEEFLKPPATALDYGCGPQPLLAELLNKRGYQCSVYDPLFFPQKEKLLKQYDLISCTEVFEHFHSPKKEMNKLMELLKPQGILAVMTQPPPIEGFDRWHYLSDLTHLCFYSRGTLHWIANTWGLELVYHEDDIALFRKTAV
ncbi:MAG: class I SAM-dependent methyltransferase [Spirochaetaceae bacterium]|nr:class I SAM-dependent methyltransferase [Spirochaetaceae bacterium]